MEQETIADLAERVEGHVDAIEQDAPAQSFLVGGAVRDAVLGLDPVDFDFVVVGETPESMEENGFEPIEASSFPVFHDSEHEEWALARKEEKSGAGYKGFDVFTDDVSLQDDLLRRDLTMNALAMPIHRMARDPDWAEVYTPLDGDTRWSIIDAHRGVRDIENGVIRRVSFAFREDPLRVMRAARYAARFAAPTTQDKVKASDKFAATSPHSDTILQPGFRVEADTQHLMREVAPELNRMSRDRIGTELRKAMRQARRPSRFFEVLRDCGALSVLWPDLDRASIVPAGAEKYHAEGDVFTHTMMVLDRMHELCEEQDIVGEDRERRLLMAATHDIGKVVVADEQGGLHSDDPPTRFGGHAEKGIQPSIRIAERLGLPNDFLSDMAGASKYHMNFHDIPKMGAEELDEFVGPLGNEFAWLMLDLAHADHEGRIQQTMHDPKEGTKLDSPSTERPSFDREPFEKRLKAVFEANETVDGHTVMRDNACDEHADADDVTGRLLTKCDECPDPGPWIGEELRFWRIDLIKEKI